MLSDLPSDIAVHVKEARFYLHKFPLHSKGNMLQQLIIEASQNGTDEVYQTSLKLFKVHRLHRHQGDGEPGDRGVVVHRQLQVRRDR